MALYQAIEEYLADEGWVGDIDKDLEGVRLIRTEIIGTTRWGIVYSYIFTDGSEFVEVVKEEGATELQDGGDYDSYDIFNVAPEIVSMTKYNRI